MSSSPFLSNRKLKDFYKDKAKPAARYKGFLSFLEGTPAAEVSQFIRAESDKVFLVFFDRFVEEEQNPKKGKQHAVDVLQLLDTLKLIIRNLGDSIAKRWKFQMFARIVLKSLHRGNRHDVRMSAFECLLMLMEVFGDEPDDNVQGFTLPSFAKAIDFSPYGIGGIGAVLNDPDALCPATEMLSKRATAEMWQFFIEFISKREDNFEFWYELAKTYYLSVLYAEECAASGIKPPDQTGSFPLCPWELQVESKRVDVLFNSNYMSSLSPKPKRWAQLSMIKSLPLWDANKSLSRTIWSEGNFQITLGFCSHACRMPIQNAAAIADCLNFFRGAMMRKASLASPLLRSHWRTWWAGMTRIFFTPSQPASEEMQAHLGLCNTVVELLSYYTFELHSEMEAEHWKGLQFLLVSLVRELLSKNDSTQVQTLAEVMSTPLMNLLLVAWIRSPITTEEMWASLTINLTSLLNWKAVILQWQEKLLFVTGLLLQQFYGDVSVKAAEGSHRKTTTFQIAESKAPKDPKLLSLDWTNERTYSMWFTLLRLLGNPVSVVVGELFQLAMGCVAAVLELLLEAQRVFFPTLKEGDPPINLVEVFCPWLFDATLVDSKRGRGAIIAYTMLCEMFLQMADRSYDVGLMTHFYRVLISALRSSYSSIAWCVLRAGRALFHLNLPGVEVLIPAMLDQIDMTFSVKTVKAPPPEKVQTRCVSLLSSLMCMPDEGSTIFDRVVQCALLVANYPKVCVPKTLASSIALIGLCIFEDLRRFKRPEVLNKCLKTIQNASVHEDAEVSSMAVQILSSVAMVVPELNAIDPEILNRVISGLCGCANAMIQAGKLSNATNILHSLLDLLLATDITLTQNYSLALTVFSVCETAMCCGRSQNLGMLRSSMMRLKEKQNAAKDAQATEDQSKKKGGANVFDKLRKKAAPGAAAESSDIKESDLPADVREVNDAGEALAEMLLAHYDNFPSPAGPEVAECREYDLKHQGDDDMNPDTLFWVYNDTSILSLRQVQTREGPIVRATLRNMTGRYVWDARMNFDAISQQQVQPGMVIIGERADATFDSLIEWKAASSVDEFKRARKEGAPPKQSAERQRDGLYEVLAYLKERHPNILPTPNVRFTEPYDTLSLPEEDVSYFESTLLLQDEQERKAKPPAARPPLLTQPEPLSDPGSSFFWARLFFYHMGFTSDSMFSSLCLVDNNDKFRRTLKELDKRMCREHVKVACLRVAVEQDSQRDILHLEERSRGFQEFVDAMAWSVDLETHQGFAGNLPKRGSAPYWASAVTELVFHDTTRMPTDPGDEQQIQKKKHVGNDHVSIIWCEHYAEYDPEVIKSQFNFVHVVVYPLVNGMFRIQLKKKEQIPLFGPLIDGAVVTASMLPMLVRATVINANRVVRNATTQNYVRPVQARLKLLHDLSTRYRRETDFKGLMMEILSQEVTPEYAPPECEETSLQLAAKPSSRVKSSAERGIVIKAEGRGGKRATKSPPSSKRQPLQRKSLGEDVGDVPPKRQQQLKSSSEDAATSRVQFLHHDGESLTAADPDPDLRGSTGPQRKKLPGVPPKKPAPAPGDRASQSTGALPAATTKSPRTSSDSSKSGDVTPARRILRSSRSDAAGELPLVASPGRSPRNVGKSCSVVSAPSPREKAPLRGSKSK